MLRIESGQLTRPYNNMFGGSPGSSLLFQQVIGLYQCSMHAEGGIIASKGIVPYGISLPPQPPPGHPAAPINQLARARFEDVHLVNP